MIDSAAKPQSEDIIALRCKYCGAPLQQVESGSEFVKCESCGTLQKLVDAKAFLDQIMGQVYSWINRAIPAGFDISNATNVDPVARHSIFYNNVKPIVETEFTEYKFNSMNLLSNPLIILPFRVDRSISPANRSSQVFEFNARIRSVMPLAVDEPSRQLLEDTNRISLTYAYLLNNIALMAEGKSETFHLMAANFNQAAQLLKGPERYKPLLDRMLGLYYLAQSIDYLVSGKAPSCRASAAQGFEKLETAKKEVFGNIEYAVMYQSIDKESTIAKIILNMAGLADRDPSNNPLATIALMERIIRINTAQCSYATEKWRMAFLDSNRLNDLISMLSWIVEAKAGNSTLPIAMGGGQYLIPFWIVDLPYSFQTGALWMKKGVEAHESLLVPADFTTDPKALENPTMAITDVFRSTAQGGMFDGLTGRESSISQGGQIKNLIQNVSMNQVGSRKVVVPLSTRKEAGILVSEYIGQLKRTNSTVANKLKLSAPRVDRMILIPGEISDQGYSLPPELGSLTPRTIGRVQLLSNMTV
jgi:hypothetical protein